MGYQSKKSVENLDSMFIYLGGLFGLVVIILNFCDISLISCFFFKEVFLRRCWFDVVLSGLLVLIIKIESADINLPYKHIFWT